MWESSVQVISGAPYVGSSSIPVQIIRPLTFYLIWESVQFRTASRITVIPSISDKMNETRLKAGLSKSNVLLAALQ